MFDPRMTALAVSPLPGLERSLLGMDVVELAACGVLLLVMLACVVRWLGRGMRLRRSADTDAQFLQQFRASAHGLALYHEAAVVPGSPKCALYMNAARELAFHLLGTDKVDGGFQMRLRAAGRITPGQMKAVRRAGERSVAESSRWLSDGLEGTWLKLLPVLGLLGSLLAVMEPLGISLLDQFHVGAALWPLALALFFFAWGRAWLGGLVRRAEAEVASLEDFLAEFGALLDRNYVDHRQPIEALPSIGSMGIADGPTFSLPPSEPQRPLPARAAAQG